MGAALGVAGPAAGPREGVSVVNGWWLWMVVCLKPVLERWLGRKMAAVAAADVFGSPGGRSPSVEDHLS